MTDLLTVVCLLALNTNIERPWSCVFYLDSICLSLMYRFVVWQPSPLKFGELRQ